MRKTLLLDQLVRREIKDPRSLMSASRVLDFTVLREPPLN